MPKAGDVRADGKVFIRMVRDKEFWGTPEKLAEYREKARAKAKVQNAKKMDRYRSDPDFRETCLRQAKEYHDKDYRRSILANAKRSARHQGLPCDLESIDDIPLVTHCPVFGTPLERGSLGREASPSLDKIVPAKGYVKGNVVVVSHRVNRLKSDATLEELELLAKFYKKFAKARK